MNVLIVNHVSELGGAEWSLYLLVEGMDRRRCAYSVALSAKGPLEQKILALGRSCDIVRLESWRWWINSVAEGCKFVATIPLQVMSVLRWVRFLRVSRPDVLHVNINWMIEPVIAARLAGVPCVMHFRNIPGRLKPRFALGAAAYFRVMNLASCWIANSEATARDVELRARRPLIVVPNGLDLKWFDTRALQAATSPTEPQTPRMFRVAMVASILRLKNYPAYLQVAAAVRAEREHVRFLVVGIGDADHTAELKAQARALGVADSVEFTGFSDNVPALLTQIDVLAHTTDHEAFGRVFIEAMAARKPVVAFNAGGAAEIVCEGVTGFLAPTGDIKAMASAILRLADDPELRQHMGEAARARVEQHYSMTQHCEAIARVYEKVLR